jgi:hypothetical protein
MNNERRRSKTRNWIFFLSAGWKHDDGLVLGQATQWFPVGVCKVEGTHPGGTGGVVGQLRGRSSWLWAILPRLPMRLPHRPGSQRCAWKHQSQQGNDQSGNGDKSKMDGSRLTFFTYFNPLSIKSYSLGVLYVNNTRDGASSACRAMGYKLLRYGQCVLHLGKLTSSPS